MRVSWSVEADADLEEIYEHIAEDNPTAAAEVYSFISAYAEQQLSEHPEIGHEGRVPNTRELVVPRYRAYTIVYEIKTNVEIVAVWHAKRQYPSSFRER